MSASDTQDPTPWKTEPMLPGAFPCVPVSNAVSGGLKRSHESALGSDGCREVHYRVFAYCLQVPA